ncbi:MAG: putative methyltransferase YcgJ [Syntrophorhabdaceae bacterium PtaU1.Bin034]|jgi:demethylmenaquinone methyltransferase/2-methoxy-6-polyprenyl-1,4-benzoquinol methylase|nr:MAG: putative methyltransferase YcgJ [Syntrophorhabdaceae bacterium PtaU1.Bin034]
MSVPFERLGLLFKLFSAAFYPGRAKARLSNVMKTAGHPGVVADIGGGTGTLLDLARPTRPDLEYVCVDPALGMLKYVGPHARPIAARAEELPFGDGTIDIVLIGDAIHHFTDLRKAVEEVRRVLKPRGRLFVCDIDRSAVMGRLVVRLERLVGEPGNFCSIEELQHLLSRNGFAVLSKGAGWRYTVEAEKTPGEVETTGAGRA